MIGGYTGQSPREETGRDLLFMATPDLNPTLNHFFFPVVPNAPKPPFLPQSSSLHYNKTSFFLPHWLFPPVHTRQSHTG